MRFLYRKLLISSLLLMGSVGTWAQGFLDFSSSSATQWPDAALSQTYSNLGTQAVTVTTTIAGATGRLINTTPRNDGRGLWLSADFASRIETITITFTFSEPVTNLSFGIRGIDREVSGSNYQDRVSVDATDDKGAGVAPAALVYNSDAVYVNLVENRDDPQPHVRILNGFTEDPFDNTLTTVNFGSQGVKQLTLTYGTGAVINTGDVTSQNIFLTGLSWANIVPVELIYFRGKASGNQALLNWATAVEINSDYFTVQRSFNLKEFSDLGRVKSIGDSQKRVEYSFTDEATLPGVNYYRLKQVDRDGKFEYSKIIAVNSLSDAPRFVIYPNPSDGQEVNLRFDNLDLEGIKLVDLMGRSIPFEVNASANNSLIIKPLHTLQTGLYFITYVSSGQKLISQKLWVRQ